MKQKYLVIMLFGLIVASGATSFESYRTTERLIENDMSQALASALAMQQSNVITQDTIRSFNSHLQMAELRGKAILSVDTHGQQFKAYASCSEATIISLSDQRPATILWVLTAFWAIVLWYHRPHDSFGGLRYAEQENQFYTADGNMMQLTPMQHQLMEMFFQSPSHTLTKTEICDALWPKKPDASETLYTLIKRLKPVVEQHSNLKIESDRSKAYRLITK